MKARTSSPVPSARRGATAVITAAVMLVLIAMTALALDVGYIMMTMTQLQAACDSSTLAGGTELLPGLGRFAEKTPAEVEAAARPVAVDFASRHRAGNHQSVFADSQRDVFFGKAVFDADTGTWQRSYGAANTPYNLITVVLHRDQPGSTNGDEPLPLFFGPVLGTSATNLLHDASAVILPAKGFKVTPGSNETSKIIPIAFRQSVWERLEEAQTWYYQPQRDGDTLPHTVPSEYTPGDASYPLTAEGEPMFHAHDIDNQGNPLFDENGDPVYVQDIFDNFSYSEGATNPVTGDPDGVDATAPVPDGWLEVNIYPEDFRLITAGNAGTIDLGDTDNAASALRDQILNGLGAPDYEAMDEQGLLNESGELVLDPTVDPPVTQTVSGDTGISGGPIDQAFNQIVGQTRVMALFDDEVVEGPGETIEYTIVRFVGIRVLFADLTTGDKVIWIQMAPVSDGTAVPDLDEEIGENTTVFTPLILIE